MMESSLARTGDGVPAAKEPPTGRRRRRSSPVRREEAPRTHGAGVPKEESGRELRADDPTELPAAKRPRAEAKTHSTFVELRRTLVDAAAVANFITQHHETRLREVKQANSFYQAISNCTEDLFASLCQEHRRQVHLALERMFELYATGKVAMSPAVHEFLIRCEQHGVKTVEWATELESEAPTTATNTTTAADTITGTVTESATQPEQRQHQLPMLLLSPRELLKKLAGIDPRGRLERMIEMCSTLGDLHTCARKLCKATGNEGRWEYATTCQLISKTASKTRRICGAALLAETPHLSKEDAATLSDVVGSLLSVTRRALAARPPSSSQQPISKLSHLAKWCAGHGLLEKSHAEAVAALEAQATRDLGAQATQLETVMMLKALPAGDEAAARAALDGIWNEQEGHFKPYSADVLSSIAVVAAANGISAAFRALVAARLVKTQQRQLHGCGLQLPRRALKFVNDEYSREKQESIKRMLAAEQEKSKKTQES
ncbi:uncharacterized protein Tco025E_05362 [Trypanosoma conorhini]|uniref:Uncharacterized protein n=1 Tax=Trypanosoma conorhini TaxID=83891 RepID=A0A3R7LJS2_9TRYP|nr:uncharacterized protein Tco025E_05362 [Trypanosoma conorhini]RNF15860.1 hypothetical protein Tco025E_05362 [Trypanosoma conorhini]